MIQDFFANILVTITPAYPGGVILLRRLPRVYVGDGVVPVTGGESVRASPVLYNVRSRGSTHSRKWSPARLIDRTDRKIKLPGAKTNQGAR